MDPNGDVGRDSTKGHGTYEVHWVSHAMTYTGPVVLQFIYHLYPEITRIVSTAQVVCHKANAKKYKLNLSFKMSTSKSI